MNSVTFPSTAKFSVFM